MMRKIAFLYLSFCLVGTGLEWAYGAFWSLVGTSPWIYSNSALHYTSFEVIPLWGFGGFTCVSVYRAITERPKRLLGAAIPVILGALWVLIYARFIA